MRRLEAGGLIRKRGTLPDGTAVFMVDHEGAKYLGERLPFTTFPHHLLLHEIEINALRWRLSQLGVVKTWMTERTLRSEIMRRNPSRERSRLIVPDALILFQHFRTANAKVELEMELHMKSDQRYKARFKSFDPAIQKSPAFRWYLVRASSCGERILHFAKRYGGTWASGYIGYTVISDFWANSFNASLRVEDSEVPLHRVFAIPSENRPAQGGAQGLGTPKIQNQVGRAA